MDYSFDVIAKRFVSFARKVSEEETVWADWHNRVFGVDGEFGKKFETVEKRKKFLNSSYHLEIDQISRKMKNGQSILDYTIPTKGF